MRIENGRGHADGLAVQAGRGSFAESIASHVAIVAPGGEKFPGDRVDEVTMLALSARRGDEPAAAAFVRATQADVWRLCVHLGSRGTADDLTQETYARAFASLHRFAGRSSARTWLLSIARRVCADAVRSAVKVRSLPPDSRVTPDHAETIALHGLLDALDDERREAFVLTQLVGLSYAEAADVCNCPVGTIRSRVARARADLVDGFGADRQRDIG